MLKTITDFFKREKHYAVLFVLLIVVYGFLMISRDKVPETHEEDTQVLEEYKKAEKRLQAKVKDMGSFDAYLKDRPQFAMVVNILSGLVILALGIGVVLDYFILTKPQYRARFSLERAPPSIDWKFSLLFKFLIWFFSLNLAMSFVLSGSRYLLSGHDNFFILLHTTCAEIISFLVIYFLVLKNGGQPRDIGLWIPEGKWFREMKMGWTVYLSVLPVFAVVLLVILGITEFLKYEPPPHPLVPIFLEEGDRLSGLMIYSMTLAIFFGPIFEEIFFRGFCYPIFKKRFGAVAAMIVTSAFFAFVHDSTFAFWPIFILGLCLNFIYEKRGSLIANITLHITHNIIFLGYFFLAKYIVSHEMGG